MVSLAWGSLKKPLVDCVVQIDHAVANRFPRARERISSAAEGLQASTGKHSSLTALPLGLGRALGISLLERTEALLDALLPMQSGVTVFTTESSSSSNTKVQDEDSLSDKIKEEQADRKNDDSSLPLFRMVAVKLSSGSHSLQVTVISVQDTYSSLLERLGANRIWQCLKSLQPAEVRRELIDAARDPPTAAAKAMNFLGCERCVGSALEVVLNTSVASKLLGPRSHDWATWAHNASIGNTAHAGRASELPSSTVKICDTDDGIGRTPLPRLPCLTQTEQETALAMGLRLVVKNSFIELVPEGEDEHAAKCARRARSCDASLPSHSTLLLQHAQAENALAQATPASPMRAIENGEDSPSRLRASTGPAALAKAIQEQQEQAAHPSPLQSQQQQQREQQEQSQPLPLQAGPVNGPRPKAIANPKLGSEGAAAVANALKRQSSEMTPSARAPAAPEAIGAASITNEADRTTIMLRNLPLDLSRDALLKILNDRGCASSYSFVYLPIDFTRRRGLGYALVSGVSIAEATSIFQRLDGILPPGSEEPWQASWSEPSRSVSEHIERYRNSPVMHPSMPDEYKPVIFCGGQRVDFPPPTRTLRPPRIRHLKHTPDENESARGSASRQV